MAEIPALFAAACERVTRERLNRYGEFGHIATVEEVSAAAARHLHTEGLVLVVEGDASVIRDDLAATGLGELVELTL